MSIGYDLGRTIKGPTKEHYNSPFEGAFDTIRALSKKFKNSYVISRVNSEQRERALAWIEKENFCELTGIPHENIYFCFDRRDKALFVKGLNIRYFIDDRPNVLSAMDDFVIKLLFNPYEGDLIKYKKEMDNMKYLRIVKNWKEVGRYFNIK
jgi:hypothetical protein